MSIPNEMDLLRTSAKRGSRCRGSGVDNPTGAIWDDHTGACAALAGWGNDCGAGEYGWFLSKHLEAPLTRRYPHVYERVWGGTRRVLIGAPSPLRPS